MGVFKFGAAGALAVSMAVASGAVAAQPARSVTALPSAHTVTAGNFRTATPLRHASDQSDSGSPVLGYVLAAVVGAGIIAATIEGTSDDSSTPPSSPG